jgi:hypothetical protein
MMIKVALTSFSNNPWVVTGSSDGVTAGMDAVDRWLPTIVGTDTNATVNTSTNFTLRIRTVGSTFFSFNVTSGATTAKTTIRDDLNTAFAAAGTTLVASITGTNQLTISDSSSNVHIETDTVANGSTLSTAVGFTTGGHFSLSKLSFAAAGSAHAWIVLKQTGVHSNYEICIDWSTSYVYNMNILVGYTGFTGGSTTARPTATNSNTILSNTNWCGVSGNTAFGGVLQAMQSTDGECTRLVHLVDGVPRMFWLLDKPKNPVAGWTNPSVSIIYSTTTSVMAIATYNDTARAVCYLNGTSCNLYLTGEGAGTAALPKWLQFQQRNQVSLEQMTLPIGLASDTSGARGRHGQLYDIWWGNIRPGNTGGYTDTTYPDDSSRVYWQCADIILPWVGSVTPPGPLPITRW